MKVDTVLPVKALKDRAAGVVTHNQSNNHSRKALPFWKWLFAFFTLIIVPTCQSMPSQVTIVNDMSVQNIQVINVKNEEEKKNE